MKTLVASLLFGLFLTSIPCVASAQDAAIAETQRLGDSSGFAEQAARRGFVQYMDQQADRYRDSMNPRRIRRAEAAAQLVNSGDCGAARALAARDNDLRLLARLTEVCGRGETVVSLN